MRRIGWLAACAACLMAVAVAMREPVYTALLPGVASVSLLCLIPLLVAMARSRFDLFEPSVLIGILYFIGFPLASLMARWAGSEFDPSDSFPWFSEALGVAALGLAAWFLGYYLGPGPSLARSVPRFPRGWSGRRAAYAATGLAVAGWMAQAAFVFRGGYLHGFRTTINSRWSTTVAWVAGFALVTLALVAVQYFHARRTGAPSRLWGSALLVLFLGEIAYTIPTGWRLQLLMTLVVPVMAAYYTAGRVRWTTIVALGLTGVFLVFPLGNIYRSALSERADINLLHPSTASTNLLRSAAADTVRTLTRMTRSKYALVAVRTFVGRMNMISVLSAIVRWTPSRWPFEEGRTFEALVVSLGPPRFLIQKPVVSVGGQEFAHRYPLVRASDTVTSVGLTRVGELYVNFWLGGVVGGMWAEGVLSRFVYDYLIDSRARSPSSVLLYILFVLTFAQFVAFADYALFLKTVVVVVAVLAWITSSRHAREATPSHPPIQGARLTGA